MHRKWMVQWKVLLVGLALFAAACSSEEPAPTTTTRPAPPSATGTPEGAEPMGREAPGFYRAGPTGTVALGFNSPQDGETIEGNSIAPTFTISGYPIYFDTARKKGQHIHVILDNEPYEADYDPEKPFSPESGAFSRLRPGTHMLRAFPSREWHESIKQADGAAFTLIMFHVGSATRGLKVDTTAPLLTYSRPKGDYRWQEDPRGIMLDFYVANCTIGINDYKVKYTLNDKKTQLLTRWEPVWWKWEELFPGTHKIRIELIDPDGKPAPFRVGGVDYNKTERTFRVLAQGEQG